MSEQYRERAEEIAKGILAASTRGSSLLSLITEALLEFQTDYCPTCDSLTKENEELKRKQQDGANLITTAAEVIGEIAGLRKENEEYKAIIARNERKDETVSKSAIPIEIVVNGQPKTVRRKSFVSIGEVVLQVLTEMNYESDLSRWQIKNRDGEPLDIELSLGAQNVMTVFVTLYPGIGA